MPFSTDTDLINALNKGEEKAFIFLLDTYHNKLYAYVMGLIEDRCKAQDIIQNVFLKTWEYRNKLNPNYPIKRFLYTLAYNEFINVYKKDRAVSLLEEKHIDTLFEIVEEMNDDYIQTLIIKVSNELKKLPERSQQIFELSKKEGLTNQEIADYMNISVKTVESHLTKIFSYLRSTLAEDYFSYLFLLIHPKVKPE